MIKSFALALLMIVPIMSAHAVGTGSLKVKSALDEPLLAEIPLMRISASELASIEVRLGSESDFKTAGVDLVPGHQDLQFAVSGTATSEPRVLVSTNQPVKEPFLHFLVEISWNSGRIVREYTALLDPPLYSRNRPAAVTTPSSVIGSPGTFRPGREGVVSSGGQVGDDQTIQFGEFGPTQRGDTLWSIASGLQRTTSGVSIYQIMHALLRENPNAFVGNNINRLKTGAILRLDDLATLRQISNREAQFAYTEQLDAWQAYKLALVESSPDVQVSQAFSSSAEDQQSATDATSESVVTDSKSEPTAQIDNTEGSSVDKPVAADDVLKIVRETVDSDQAGDTQDTPASDDVQSVGEVTALRSQIITLEEELLSRELENTELMERLDLLEQQIQNTRRLLNVEDEQLALVQQQAKQQAEKELADLEAATKFEIVAETEQVSIADTDAFTESAPVDEVTTDINDEVIAEAASLAASEEQSVDKLRVSRADSPAGAWWAGLWQSAQGQWEKLVAVLGGLMALIVGSVLLRRRRQSLADYESSVLSVSEMVESPLSESSQASSQLIGDTSFLSEVGATDGGQLQTDDIDPIAEAEVYLAYGRDEQAEEVLKEAVSKHPERHELKLKLLEIYQQREDIGSFEKLAEELYPATGSSDPKVWSKVVAMGQLLNPGNPLFKEEALSGIGDTGRVAQAPDSIQEATLDDLDLSSRIDSNFSELNLNSTIKEEGSDSAFLRATEGADLNLNDLNIEQDDDKKAEMVSDVDLTDLTVDDDGVLVADGQAGITAKEKTRDSDAISEQIELSSDYEILPGDVYEPEDVEDNSTFTEAQTKLDLARAYIDMGDQIGASDILEEVIKHGSTTQKELANQLAQQLAS